ncbi:MAG TPA: PhnD/SsuA/transferrin family substrate-binding protein [Pseudolabrys sp.]|uniref:PhnD/SsuA/transferrin family substrate-binding protein n=1 Tax=Pseudolabrys sp. TaxID=1960880 RepID=UPI002DDD7BB5|nr:PhnD/SsuA/transferrin family substrate-binding protein [Pseudolabrys sp.]HEV2627964.1 PhnD/SsuA/transferrin family substrate-binding protein [Pseudolabrys sp.]
MSKNVRLTLACGEYESVRALLDGTVEVDGVDLTILTDMDSATRHWRFLRNNEFDIAEVSASSYLAARDRDWPVRAIPVFLHRRFRHGFMFINTGKGISKPADLRGKRIGVKTLMTTAVLWMRGILQEHYGVPLDSIEWFAELDDDVQLTADVKVSRLPDNKSVETMLAEGELDAVFHADIIKPFLAGDPRVGRLFPDHKAEEMAYFQKTGIFPIMHVTGIRKEIADAYPWLAVNLFRALNAAKATAMKRMANPRIVPLAWYRAAWEEQQAVLGPDPWEYGLTEKNRRNLETLVGYSHGQGLIRRRLTPDDLFLNVDQGRKRGGEYRI